MANLQSQIDILAKAVVNEHVRVSNLQTVSVSDVTSKVPVYDIGGVEINEIKVDYNHQVYELKDKNEIIGTFFGYNNGDKYFGGIWCHDDLNNYVIDQYGDIVSSKKDKVDLIDDSYVRRIGLKDEEYDIDQGTKNGSRMIYVGETETAEVGGKTIIYNKNTLRIVDGSNNEYVGCIYLNFENELVIILDEINKNEIKYSSVNGCTIIENNINIIIKTTSDLNYCYYVNNNSAIVVEQNKLKNVIVSTKVTTIGDRAFYNCISLTSVNIPNSVTTIGNQAFYNCTSLTSVNIPNSVTSIGQEAFVGCSSLQSFIVDINNIDFSIDTEGVLFNKNQKTLIQYPRGKYTIDYTIPETVEKIGDYAFSECSELREVIMGNSVTDIGVYAFYKCECLESITIGKNVKTISDYAFYECFGLTSVTIPDLVTTISDYAFYRCMNLIDVYIPNNNEIEFGTFAFDNRDIETVHIIIEQEDEDISTIKDKLISIGIDIAKIATIPREIFNQQFP